MTATTFLTQRQLMSKNMPADALTGPYAQQQKLLLYVLPVVFAVGGIAFPIGVLLYWTTSNLWTMGQQFYVIRNNPVPGTPASRPRRTATREGRAQGTSRGRGARCGRPTAAEEAAARPSAPAAEEADPLSSASRPAQPPASPAEKQPRDRPGPTEPDEPAT